MARIGPAAFARAEVVLRCPHGHVTKKPAGEAIEITEGGRVLTFKRFIECPLCWRSIGAFAPPFCSVVGIEWEPPWQPLE